MRSRLARLATAVVALVALPLFSAACGAGDVLSPAAGASVSGGATTAATGGQTDWQHTLQVIANVRASQPTVPAVYFLGGSVVRECVVSEESWATAVVQSGGPTALTYDLGSSNRTTAQDIKLVTLLPEVPSLVFIGVNVGRFTPARSDPAVTLPDADEPLPTWKQHRYSSKHILTKAEKRAELQKWLTRRYPIFKTNYAYNLGRLERLVKVCKARGFHPVLVDLPRNKAIIGHALDTPVGRYRRSCGKLAAKYGIPFVSLVGKAQLANGDFYDLWHLVEPGRTKWQALLARRTAALLLRYGMTGPPPTTSPSGSASPTPPVSPGD